MIELIGPVELLETIELIDFRMWPAESQANFEAHGLMKQERPTKHLNRLSMAWRGA